MHFFNNSFYLLNYFINLSLVYKLILYFLVNPFINLTTNPILINTIIKNVTKIAYIIIFCLYYELVNIYAYSKENSANIPFLGFK